MRRLGIDLGTVRTGLAIAEPDVLVATPLCTIRHAGLPEAVRLVSQTAAREHIEQAIVGLPLRLDGTEGDAARRVRQFAQALRHETRLPVKLWDERLTSVAAHASLRVQRVSGREQRRVVDQVAATLILQSFLDQSVVRRRCDVDELDDPAGTL